jgi:hypothetical protein
LSGLVVNGHIPGSLVVFGIEGFHGVVDIHHFLVARASQHPRGVRRRDEVEADSDEEKRSDVLVENKPQKPPGY